MRSRICHALPSTQAFKRSEEQEHKVNCQEAAALVTLINPKPKEMCKMIILKTMGFSVIGLSVVIALATHSLVPVSAQTKQAKAETPVVDAMGNLHVLPHLLPVSG
jgi:hypothetical protein